MRSIRVLLFLLASLPAGALAKPWQGIVPGRSSRGDVVTRFGDPSTQGKLGDRTALVYKGDQALTGTRQAQFFLREDGVVVEITVFPGTQLDRESVEGTYGPGAHKTFTDDFRPVWVYRSLGVTVYFGKDGTVDAISFKAADGPPAAPPASAPTAPVAPKAPAAAKTEPPKSAPQGN